MSSQTSIPGTWGSYASSVGTPGTGMSWTNPANAGSTSSGSVANDALSSSAAKQSYALEGSACGFSVSGTVNGITQTFTGDATANSGSHFVEDAFVQMLVSSPGTTPTVSANNYGLTSTKWPTSFAAVTYGTGTTDLWGSSWTAAQINGSGFGVLIQVSIENTTGSTGANLYDSSVTVYYTASSAAPRLLMTMGCGS